MLGRTLSIGLLAALLGAALGCTDSGQTLLILQNQAPGVGCQLSTSTGAAFFGRGLIDTASAQGYVLNPLVQNLADSPPASSDITRVAFIEGYDVSLSAPGGGSVGGMSSFSSLISAVVFPGSITAMSIEVLPKESIDSLGLAPGARTTVVAEVTLFGKIDGGDVESTPFAYPIEVCNGCLEVNVGSCAELADSFSPRTGGNCNPLQDIPTDCCTPSAGGALVCPAVKE